MPKNSISGRRCAPPLMLSVMPTKPTTNADLPLGGVLIVGSLWWRKDELRSRWRDERLELGEAELVWVPIRYGRLSQSGSYTMVFSNSCSRAHRLGIGRVVPFRCLSQSAQDLGQEALWLARAESNDVSAARIHALWYSVGILFNPESKHRRNLTAWWDQIRPDLKADHLLFTSRLKSERPIMSSRAHLNLRWPRRTDGSSVPCDLDFLLAAATVPTLTSGKYPPVAKIADAWLADDEYFRNNESSGIRTAQDDRIRRRIQEARDLTIG